MLPPKINRSQFGFCLWILQIMIILGLSVSVIWLSTRPKAPIYTLTDFYVPAFDFKNNTSHGATQNHSLFVDMEISNPNKRYGIFYDQMSLTFSHGDAVVGVSSIASFYQGHKKTTRMDVRLIGNQELWKWASSPVLNGTADLKVGLVSPIRFKTFLWKSRTHRMELQAHALLGSDGKMHGVTKIKLNHTVAFPISIRY